MTRQVLHFVCVGPQRTATSWLDRVLRHNSKIALPYGVKETFFIDRSFDKGWDWYFKKYFPFSVHKNFVSGEIAPTLFHSRASMERLYSMNPKCLIVVCVRDPVARSLSLFEHYVATRSLPNEWAQAVSGRHEIVDASRYSCFVQDWAEYFGSEQVLLVPNGAIEKDPNSVLAQICHFLDIPFVSVPPESTERYGVAARPRYPYLAAIAIRFARVTRAIGLHSLANLGKRLGVKRLLFSGGSRPKLGITDEQRLALENLLEQDRHWVAQVERAGVCTLADLQSRGLDAPRNG